MHVQANSAILDDTQMIWDGPAMLELRQTEKQITKMIEKLREL